MKQIQNKYSKRQEVVGEGSNKGMDERQRNLEWMCTSKCLSFIDSAVITPKPTIFCL